MQALEITRVVENDQETPLTASTKLFHKSSKLRIWQHLLQHPIQCGDNAVAMMPFFHYKERHRFSRKRSIPTTRDMAGYMADLGYALSPATTTPFVMSTYPSLFCTACWFPPSSKVSQYVLPFCLCRTSYLDKSNGFRHEANAA